MVTKNIIVIGDKEILKNMDMLNRQAPKLLGKLLLKAATATQAFAIISIQSSPGGGRTYKRRGVSHTASLPGSAPRTDTGNLVRNITVKKEGNLSYTVGSRKDAPYGFWLEFGTSRMAPRPWLTPAGVKAIAILNSDIKAGMASVRL